MPRFARRLGSLQALAVAIEASERVDPYPRLTRLLQRRTYAAAEPYPRLAQLMEHLAAPRADMRAAA